VKFARISLPFLLFLCWNTVAWAIPPAPWEADELMGKTAPAFTLTALDGKKVSLSDVKGKVVLLNFWATWCPPCKAEIPSMNALYQELSAQGFTILAVSSDRKKEHVTRLLEKTPVDFTILHDPENDLASVYKVFALPTSFIISFSRCNSSFYFYCLSNNINELTFQSDNCS